jgi:hypothetical protein
MRGRQIANIPTSHVMALFTDTKIAFSLTNGATFADLANSVAELCDRYADSPTAVYLRTNNAKWPVSALHSGI